MKTLDGVFDEITSFAWLEQAYRDARRNKRYREEILLFSENLDANLIEIQEQLRDGTFVFGPYRRHWVTMPKKRRVMALPFNSRIAQWAVYNLLNPFYDRLFIEDSYGCRIGRFRKDKDGRYIGAGSNRAKGSLAAAFRLQYWLREADKKQERWYILKMDISKFFYRIDHQILMGILQTRIRDQRLLDLLWSIIDSPEPFGLPPGARADEIPEDQWLHGVGVPIGNLTSQLFGNIYLNELDQYAKHVLKVHRYARYMDDIVIVVKTPGEAQRIRRQIAAFLKEHLHLDLNKKTAIFPADHPVEFVGYIVSARHLRLRKKTARRIKRVFRAICYRLATGHITREAFDRRVSSYAGMIGPCDADGLRCRLNQIYISQLPRGQPS